MSKPPIATDSPRPSGPVRPGRSARWLRRLSLAAGVGAGCALIVAIAAFAWSSCMPGSRVWCRCVEVDVATGRLRQSSCFFGFTTDERVLDSFVTRVLGPERVAAATPQWQTVSVFAPGRDYSPHYVYHSASGQIKMLESICREECPEDARLRAVEGLLECWREGSDGMANVYLYALMEKALGASETTLAITVRDVDDALRRARSEVGG